MSHSFDDTCMILCMYMTWILTIQEDIKFKKGAKHPIVRIIINRLHRYIFKKNIYQLVYYIIKRPSFFKLRTIDIMINLFI